MIPTEVELMRVGVHQIRAGLSWMDSIVAFLKEGTLPNDKGVAKKKKYEEKLPAFGCPRSKSCISALLQGRIYFAFTLMKWWNHC